MVWQAPRCHQDYIKTDVLGRGIFSVAVLILEIPFKGTMDTLFLEVFNGIEGVFQGGAALNLDGDQGAAPLGNEVDFSHGSFIAPLPNAVTLEAQIDQSQGFSPEPPGEIPLAFMGCLFGVQGRDGKSPFWIGLFFGPRIRPPVWFYSA